MKRIGVFANVTRDGIAAHVERIASLASARGVDVLLSSDLEELCPVSYTHLTLPTKA